MTRGRILAKQLSFSAIAKFGGWQTLTEAHPIERYPAHPMQKGGRQTIYIGKRVCIDFPKRLIEKFEYFRGVQMM